MPDKSRYFFNIIIVGLTLFSLHHEKSHGASAEAAPTENSWEICATRQQEIVRITVTCHAQDCVATKSLSCNATEGNVSTWLDKMEKMLVQKTASQDIFSQYPQSLLSDLKSALENMTLPATEAPLESPPEDEPESELSMGREGSL